MDWYKRMRGEKHVLLTKYVLRNKFDFTYMLETELPVLFVVYREKGESGGKKKVIYVYRIFLGSFFWITIANRVIIVSRLLVSKCLPSTWHTLSILQVLNHYKPRNSHMREVL